MMAAWAEKFDWGWHPKKGAFIGQQFSVFGLASTGVGVIGGYDPDEGINGNQQNIWVTLDGMAVP